jgi:predicted nucleic acid-binding protein
VEDLLVGVEDVGDGGGVEKLALLIKEDFEVVPLDSPLFSKAMTIYGEDNIDVSLRDSLIVASAILNQCDTLYYSEDMQYQLSQPHALIKAAS